MATTPPLRGDLPASERAPTPLFDFRTARPGLHPHVHHPALDGLRGAAVAAVLAYHHDATRAPGGFLGVDVFFVLSGFLITGLLLREHHGTGTISLRRFWVARVRRLAPALLVTILLVAGVARWAVPPEMFERLRWDALAGLAQVANWRFVIDDQSYFFDFSPSPLRHLWSLAVEEQWYLVWPLVCLAVLAGSLADPRRAARRLLVVCLGLALASSLAMAWVTRDGGDLSRAYYGTDTHATGLLLGAALAATVQLRPRVASTTVAAARPSRSARLHRSLSMVVVGIVGLASAALVSWAVLRVGGTSLWLYRGGFALVALASVGLVLACTSPDLRWRVNPVGAVLALWPLRWLGRISYGVYLYHWPIFYVVTTERTGQVGWRLFAVRLAITLGAAALSYRFVERPVRLGALRGRRGAALGVASLAAVVVLVLSVTAPSRTSLLQRPDLDVTARPVPEVPVTQPGEPPEAVPSRVLVVGDSVGFTLATGFEEDGLDEEVLVWNQGILYCELLDLPRREAGETRVANQECLDWPTIFAERIDEFDPDVAVLHVGPWEIFDRVDGDRTLAWDSPELDERYRRALGEAVEVLGAEGATVVLLASPPLDRTDGVSNPEWTMEERGRIHHLTDLLEEVEASTSVPTVVIDMADLVCPTPASGCPATVEGVELRGDGVHYTAEGAEVAAAWLTPRLRALALDAHDRRNGSTTPGTLPPP